MAPNVKEMCIDELWEVYEAIKEDDPEFESSEERLMQDIHKWYTGEELELEEVEVEKGFDEMTIEERVFKYRRPCDWGCECFMEFDWRQQSPMLNPNQACETCMYVYENKVGYTKWSWVS